MKEKEIKILAGITENDELYFLNVTTERDGKPYFSMTGDTHTPITVEDAKARTEEQYSREVDNSIFDITVEVDGEDYIFESQSCGQHQEKTLKHYFVDKNSFKMLLKAWDLYHMKNVDVHEMVLPMPFNSVSVGYMLDNLPKQNIEALAMQAITTINSEL